MIINDLFNNKKFVAEEESEAAARRKQYPSYYQHRDAGTVFRTQNDVGQTMNITPDDEEWDDYYRQQFPDMPTPNDGGFWSDDNTAAMVEGMDGQVVFSGTGADGGKYEIIQSSPTDFMIHANGRHIDTYGSLQRAMSVLKNEVQGLQQGVAEGTLDEAVGMMIKGAAISGANDQDIADRIAAKTGGRVDSGSYGHHVLITYPTTQHRAEAAVKIRKMFPGIELYKSGGNRNAIDEQGVAEGSELKQAKRKYNQAAKDANTDQVGAGKKIDTMKKSLRQKDVDNKKQGVAEGSKESYMIIRTDSEGKKDVFAGNFDTYEQAQKELDGLLDHPLHTKYKQKFEIKRKGGEQGVAEDDGFDDVSNYTDMRTTDTGNKSNQTYTSTAIAKNSATGQQKSLASWDHTDPKTGKNYSGSNYIDAQGNAEVQKNYKESKNPVPGQDFTTAQGQQMKYNPASKNWQQQAPVTPNDPHTNISTASTMNTKDANGTPTTSYSNTTMAKNPATGSTQTMTSNDRGSFLNGVDEDQLDELDKKTVASWVRQQPERIKGNTGLSRTDFKKAKRLVDKSIPSAIAKYKDPSYGKQEPRLDEVSLGDYRKKATMSKAMAQTNKFFDRDSPEKVAAADRTIANRTKGLAGADARRRPYTAPPVDQDKQRRDLADKYPNIDELVRQAELRRDPQYDRAEGNAYYAGRDAEHNYHRLKQIQRMIRGAELDEMNFGGVNQTTDSATGDITTSFNQGPVSVSQTKTPGGYTKQTDQQFNLGTATLGARTVGPNIGAGQLAGTTTRTATNNMTGQSQQQVRGVGFGGATGPTVGKNYVGSSDDELARHAASVFKENVDRITHLAGLKPSR